MPGDDHSSLRSTRNYPELSGRCGRHLIPVRPCFGRGLPCSWTLVLARWALTPPFHPYPGDGAVYFLWHCPARGVLSTVSRISPGLPVLRSPDFPLSLQGRRSGRPRRYSTRIKSNPSQSEWQRADGPKTMAQNSGRTGRRRRCRLYGDTEHLAVRLDNSPGYI